jgi:hypothetical protein
MGILNSPNPTPWQSPDLTVEQLATLEKMSQHLSHIFPEPITITEEDLANGLTEDQAWAVHRAARRMLLVHLLHQEFHQHVMDDCGDYLSAASDGWTAVFNDGWMNDFQDYPAHITAYLTDLDRYPVGGCDGEVRLSIIPNFDGFEED